ncbi:MAG: SapC family protein [Gammaproteobacteria bacterium]|nr:SapC family protein [Gammaproteobacteria bacterium]
MAPGLPALYRNLTPLDRTRHREWYLDPDHGYRFAAGAQVLPLAAIEFPPAARDFPIVFLSRDDGTVAPVALLGLRPGRNAVVDAQGRWTGRYLPAYLRRYPFMPVPDAAAPDRYTVCIDETYSGFNTVAEGAKLLDERGEAGPAVRQCLEFLEEYHRQTQATAAFCAAVVAADLLEPMQATVKLGDGETFALNGFLCATRARIKALTATQVHALVAQEYLELLYLHLHSLANVDKLAANQGPARAEGG